MNKAHQQIRDMFEAARKCRDAGIRVTLNLIFGYPGEEEQSSEGNAAGDGRDRGAVSTT